MNIAYCLNSIKGIGGIQKTTIIKANALAEIEGNHVFIIVTDNQENVQCEKLSPKVNFIHLEVNYYYNDWKPGLKSKISQFYKKILHKKRLKEALNAIKPDVVISVGQSEKFFCRKGLVSTSNPVFIRELHFVTHFRNILAKTNLAKMKAKIQNFIDFKMFSQFFYDAIIPLTPKDVEKNWKNSRNAYFIPNPITFHSNLTFEQKIKLLDDKEKKIIAVGRLTYIKNFKSLINAFSLIASDCRDWVLEIYGDGEDYAMLNVLIKNKRLENQVLLKGFSNMVDESMKKSSILALTSIMEGFPLVMFEAMSLGNAIVAYDCDFGPSYIVDDNINGFLVENGNEIQLAEKLKTLINNEELRKSMAIAAIEKSQKFTPEIITENWMALFRKLMSEKKK